MMLRWISAVPPQIVSEREKKNGRLQFRDRVVGPAAAHAGDRTLGVTLAGEDLTLHAEHVDAPAPSMARCASDQNILLHAPEQRRVVGAVERVGERAIAVDLHDLDLLPRAHEIVAHEQVVVLARGASPRRR